MRCLADDDERTVASETRQIRAGSLGRARRNALPPRYNPACRDTTSRKGGTEFHNRIASTIDERRGDATTLGCNSSRCAWQPPRADVVVVGYDTKLLRAVSYQAANQSSCHNGADVATAAAAATVAVAVATAVAPTVAAAKAASDTSVEFSSKLLQTVLVYSGAEGGYTGAGGVARVRSSSDRAGSLRRIFTNNNRHPTLVATTTRRDAVARVPSKQASNQATNQPTNPRASAEKTTPLLAGGGGEWRHRFAICLALVGRHHFLVARAAARLTSQRAQHAIYPEFRSAHCLRCCEVVVAPSTPVDCGCRARGCAWRRSQRGPARVTCERELRETFRIPDT